MQQLSIYDEMFPKFKIDKPVRLRLIELFAGIGAQAKALKNLGINFEHYKTCEWAIPSILAYQEIHKKELKCAKYDSELSDDDIYDYLALKGISANYNEPLSAKSVRRINKIKARDIYNAIISEHNLVNIMTTSAADLNIVETDIYTYILTYSFPCQDLSLAGKGAGMSKGSSTRSGLLWEVERLLDECKTNGAMPQVLLMENVPQVIGTDNIKDFQEWEMKLERLGYSNYVELLNAKDYGIPQNRKRCFMVSILGEYAYTFPPKQELKLKLKDLLEEKVDEKYFLSDKLITSFSSMKNRNGFIRGLRFKPHDEKSKYAYTISTHPADRATDNFISETVCLNPKVDGKQPSLQNRIYDSNGIATAVTTCFHPFIAISAAIRGRTHEDGTNKQKIEIRELSEVSNALTTDQKDSLVVIAPENTKKGYAVAKVGDGIYTNRPHQKRGVVQKNMIPTLKCSVSDIGVVVDTEEWISIRKLTPKECYRLFGFSDEDYDNAAKVISQSMLYHTAGDSIVVNVLMALFEQMM